jgi:tetratricopeptide (TPR) repeat protein
MARFQRFGDVKDIDFAIEKFVEAVATISLDSPDRPSCLYNLGNSYFFRFISNQEPTDLEESFSNLRLSSFSLNGRPSMRIQGSLQWAHHAHKLGNLESASEGYDQAIRLLPQVAWIGLTAIAQLKELNSTIDIQTRLGCDAAACMIALAEAEDHNRQRQLGRAIELLDQGRSILWSQTSNFKLDLEDLKGVDSDLADDLDNVGKFLAQGCFYDPKDPLSETDAQLYRRYAEKW